MSDVPLASIVLALAVGVILLPSGGGSLIFDLGGSLVFFFAEFLNGLYGLFGQMSGFLFVGAFAACAGTRQMWFGRL